MTFRRSIALVATLGALMACSDNPADPMGPGEGRIALRLTDAPFPLDDVESIDVFVVRVEAKFEATTEAEADLAVEPETDAEADGWVVLASPNAVFDLMTLQGGVSVPLGDAAVEAGTYRSLRLILDTEQSGVTLKDGTILTGASAPSILFPSAGKTGIKVLFDTPIQVEAGVTTDVLVDFDAEESFVLRGNTILQNGLLFKPVIRASII